MKYATTTSHKSTRGFVVVEYGADESGRMSPVCRLKRCLHSLVGVGGECRIQKAGRRERKTGPRHALTRLRCTTHRVSFVLYPLGHIPYGRVAVVEQSAGSPKPESRDDVVSAAAAWCAGRRWEEELIEDDPGPVRRTQWRRINQLAQRLGLDSKKVDSRILEILGLPAEMSVLKPPGRVAVLVGLGPGIGAWLRLAGALDFVSLLGPVGIGTGVTNTRLRKARSAWARMQRGPPMAPGGPPESVLDRR